MKLSPYDLRRREWLDIADFIGDALVLIVCVGVIVWMML